MTDMQQRGGIPGEPPLSLDVLADLHAGVLPDDVGARLWPRVRADPSAESMLTALDATQSRPGRARHHGTAAHARRFRGSP